MLEKNYVQQSWSYRSILIYKDHPPSSADEDLRSVRLPVLLNKRSKNGTLGNPTSKGPEKQNVLKRYGYLKVEIRPVFV